MIFLQKSQIPFIEMLKDSGLFRKIYIVTLTFEMIAFLNVIAMICKCIMLLWGVFLVLNEVYTKKILKSNYYKILLLFILSSMITCFLNFNKNFLINLFYVIHSAICFFVFFGITSKSFYETVEKEMVGLLNYFFFFVTIFSIAGITLVLFKPHICIGNYFFGILDNRLTSFFLNSNLLAFSTVIAIISSHFLLDKTVNAKINQKNFFKVILIFGSILNLFVLFLSDSNTSFLFIIIYFVAQFICDFFIEYYSFQRKKVFYGSFFLLSSGIIITTVSFFLRNVFQYNISLLINNFHRTENPMNAENEAFLQENPEFMLNPMIIFGRKNYDISSGRIILFQQGFQIFKKHPFFGIGRANLILFGEEYLKDGIIFTDLHNGYLTILVSYGLCGFIIFIIFSVLIAIEMCRFLFKFKNKSELKLYSKFFSVILAYSVYSLFEKTILSEITFMVAVFWLFLGYVYCYVQRLEKNEKPC